MTEAPLPGQGGDTQGAIQPHGWLLACDERATIVQRHSGNLQHLFPARSEPFLGANLRDILGSEAAHGLRNALSRFAGPARPALLPGWSFPGCEGSFDLAVHASGEETIIEIERSAPGDPRSVFDRTRAMIERVAATQGIDRLLLSSARLLASMLLYEHVAILRFDADGSAHILAEQKGYERTAQASGDRVAKNIPQEARRLYRDGRVRIIVDASAESSKILGLPDAAPLDLTFAHLRGLSQYESQAMQGEGHVAALMLAIVVQGELWGLIACHDRAPKNPGMDLRAATELFGDFLSLQLQVRLQQQAIEQLRAPQPAATLQSPRIMIVEDQALIAMDLEASLHEHGAEVACIATTSAQALAALDRTTIDAAVLDYSLGEETSLDIADELELRGIPFVFATGHGDDLAVPARFAGRLTARKPYDAPKILTALREALAKGPSHETSKIQDP